MKQQQWQQERNLLFIYFVCFIRKEKKVKHGEEK